MERTCRTCGITKPLEQFVAHARSACGYTRQCRSCANAADRARHSALSAEQRQQRARRLKDDRLRRDHGIDLEEYERRVAEQGGVCGICTKPPRRHFLVVDHCHTTGAIRGLLCNPCNLGLGLLLDDPQRIRRVAAYLAGR